VTLGSGDVQEPDRPTIDVFAAAPDAIVVVDDQGVIASANQLAGEMFGYDAADLIGQPLETLIPERFRDRHVSHRKSYSVAPTRRPMGLSLALFGRRRSGEEFPVEISLNYQRDKTGRVQAIAFVRDATAKRRMEEELRATEESFRLLVEGVEDYAIFRLDPSGRVVTWNQGAERVKGWSRDEILGRHISVFYRPEDVAAGIPERELERAASEGRVQSEGWRVRAGGQRFWAETTLSALRDPNGTLRGFAKVTRDRTESRQVRARLESVAALNRAVLERRPEEELLDLTVARARAMLSVAAVALWSPSGQGTLVVSHAEGENARALLGVAAVDDSSIVRVARTGRAEVVQNLYAHPAVPAELGTGGFASAAFVALNAGTDTFGVLAAVTANGAEPLQPHEVDLLQAFCTQAAVSLAHARARGEAEQLHLVSERERIARDLHDTVIQRLFAVGLSLEATSRRPTPEVQDRLHQAVSDIDDTIRAIRSSIFTLETQTETAPGLRSSVLEVMAEAAPTLGFEPAVSFDGPVDTLASGEITESLTAVLREALSNVARHAQASVVSIEVRAHDDMTLVVTDNGSGATSFERDGGHGVANLRERARLLSGDASITSVAPHGTRVEWTVPLPH
jgi:PAS domain S-box-containing protein